MWFLFLFAFTAGATVSAGAQEYSLESDDWGLTAVENSGDGITLRFELLDYRLDRGKDGFTVKLDGVSPDGGDPLPLVSTWLELPPDAAVSLEQLSIDVVVMPDCPVAPLIESSDRWNSDFLTTSTPTTRTSEQWPVSARMTPPAIMRDRRVTQISIAPFRVAPDGISLLRTDQLELFLSFDGHDCSNCNQLQQPHPSRIAEQQFANLLLNYRPSSAQENRDLPRGGYVIFFPELARSYLYPLISWKRELGWDVDTVCTTPDNMDYSDIQDYLQTEWDLGNSFDFVLLVGDKDLYDGSIPMDAHFFNGGPYAEPEWGYQDVTDHPYSLLAGDDYLPEVLVGRISVDTAGQLQTVVNKILCYERDVILPEEDPHWPDRALMICDWWVAWSRLEVMRQVRDDLLAYGYSEVDTIYSHYWEPIPASAVFPPVNEGVSYINYRGYGHRYAWVTPFFTNEDIQSGIHNNNKLPVVTSIVCGGGDFASYGSDPCFGEAWVRHGTSNQLKGAVAFIGPSELDTHTRWNNIIDLGIYQGVIQEELEYLGQLLTRGKMELFRNNPDWHDPGGPNNSVHFYFHTFNLLGDPGLMLMTGTPVTPEVHFPNLIPLEQGQVPVEVTLPEAGRVANVTLYDEENDQAFSAWTDEAGLALIDIPDGLERSWTLTVSGYGLIPVQSLILQSGWQSKPLLLALEAEQGGELVVGAPQEVQLRAANHTDSVLPAETVLLQAAGLSFAAEFQLPEIAPGAEVLSSNSVELSCEDFTLAMEELLFHGSFADEEPGAFEQLLHGPRLEISQTEWSDENDNLPERGENGQLSLTLLNSGDRGFDDGFTADLLLQGCLTSTAGQLSIPALLPAETSSDVIQLSIDAECVNGSINGIALEADGELNWLAATSLTVGELDWTDPAGPDPGGYYAYHSNDEYLLAPLFEWLELDPEQEGPGTPLNINDTDDPGQDDPYGETVVLELPFPFHFYGQEYDRISVCSNGWLAPGISSLTTWRNSQIPGANGPSGMVAPFWDDLYNRQYTRLGDIFYWYDEEGGRFYIEWSEFRIANAYPAMSQNFQVVIHDPELYPTVTGDSELVFHYLDYQNLDAQDNYCTIGIESPDELYGIEYSFNHDFWLPNQQLGSQHSIRFTTGRVADRVTPAPLRAELVRGFPNPFNSSFTLQFSLQHESEVEIAIYNLLGERVTLLQQGPLTAGQKTVRWEAEQAPAGLYFYHIRIAGQPQVSGRCLLIK